ncbi:DUF4932 domain-containing protein [Spirosoma sp. SC4-14]|uniref:DUF4932 domain-containing protein n=1 Tax=Spirosoma sp. SC4-14 TaxID=3128900 RepID=UPI0030CE4E74
MRVIAVYLLIFLRIIDGFAQTKPIPTIHTKQNFLIMYLDGERDKLNGINQTLNPFSYNFGLTKPSVPFRLVSEKDSISMFIRYGETTDFRVIREGKGDTLLCHFTSHEFVKAAVFTDTYKKANEGKTVVEIPETYELFNIVVALTEYGKTEAVYKKTDYYQSMMQQFTPYKNHPAVRTLDSLLAKSGDSYHPLKMDSYAYWFEGDQIRKGGIYDRVSWGDINELTPYVPLLEQFAKQSGFRAFYQKNNQYYQSLILDFQKNVDVAAMKIWLEKQFPATHYSAVKVIFSPLVGWNQSANHFSDNGFTEAQMHINFPFIGQKSQPAAIARGQRMTIAFTELNHSYLNPEADKYDESISAAFGDLSKWTTPNTPSLSYGNALSCFEEYMNYALVTLLYYDLFDTETAEKLRLSTENGMVQNRGFRKFREFDQELLRLYKTRKPGQTVADLYPAIIAWSAKQ